MTCLENFNKLDSFYQEIYLVNDITNPLAFYTNRRLIYKFLLCLAETKKIKVNGDGNLIGVVNALRSRGVNIFSEEIVLKFAENDNVAIAKSDGVDISTGDDGYELLKDTRNLVKDYFTGKDIFVDVLLSYNNLASTKYIVNLTHSACVSILVRMAEINNIEFVLPSKMRLLYLTDILGEKLNKDITRRLINIDYYFEDFKNYKSNHKYRDYCIKLLVDMLLLL